MCSLETSVVPPEDAGVLLRTFIAVSLREAFSHTRALVSAVGAQLHAILIAEAEVLAGDAFGRHWSWFLWAVTHVLLHILFRFYSRLALQRDVPFGFSVREQTNPIPVSWKHLLS